MAEDFSTQRIFGIQGEITKAQSAQQSQIAARYAINQEIATEEFQEWGESMNPMAIARRFESLEIKARKKEKAETEKTEKKEQGILEIQKLEEIAEQYQKKNPEELHSRSLLLLRARISIKDSDEEILRKVLESFPDRSLADEALDFLIATTDKELAEKIRKVRARFNEVYGREIRAGKNIAIHAREFSKQGIGTPTGLRDLYRDITGNPRDASSLFSELSGQFPFEKMTTVIGFILHSLGSDLKSKGPSISSGELHRLMTEARSLQAILGVYRFFRSRMKLISSSFEREDLLLPSRVTFEALAKLFVKFLLERYPSAEKVFQIGIQLGVSDELIAEMIIYTQMRDAVRQVAPKLFRSDQHRQDVLTTFIEALEEIEEKIEEEKEKDDEGKEKEK